MTGPEHYREAERLLAYAKEQDNAQDRGWMTRAQVTAEAQVHATLALAAATALNQADQGMWTSDWQAWHDTAGIKAEGTETR